MKTYFVKDPLYKERFSNVWLWSEWADLRPDFEGTDTGIDLVAEERQDGYCAIQCKCYAPGTQISKSYLDSFISASARDPFTARIVVDTGDGWGPNAVKTITPLKPACTVLRFGDLASRPFDWPHPLRCGSPDLDSGPVVSKNTNELKIGVPGRFGLEVFRLGWQWKLESSIRRTPIQVCSAKSRSGVDCAV